MRAAIMQPYIFPYIGYFHLIEASDLMIFYDDVNFKKRGWINRNQILLHDKAFMFTIPVFKASQNKLINEIQPRIDDEFRNKFYKQLESAYHKAPYYDAVYGIVQSVIESKDLNIADLAIRSISEVYKYIDYKFNWKKSSIASPHTRKLSKADRLIQIAKEEGCNEYVNLPGGKDLYDREYFSKADMDILFIESNIAEYNQLNANFVGGLSIIDILMFNDKINVHKLFTDYSLS